MKNTNRTTITMAIEDASLTKIDKTADKHQMSRTGFMVYSSLKYADELNNEGTNGSSNS